MPASALMPCCRNPRECTVAKMKLVSRCNHGCVATRTNALWQMKHCSAQRMKSLVATRTNALWQRAPLAPLSGRSGVATRANALWQSRAIVVPEPETPRT